MVSIKADKLVTSSTALVGRSEFFMSVPVGIRDMRRDFSYDENLSLAELRQNSVSDNRAQHLILLGSRSNQRNGLELVPPCEHSPSLVARCLHSSESGEKPTCS